MEPNIFHCPGSFCKKLTIATFRRPTPKEKIPETHVFSVIRFFNLSTVIYSARCLIILVKSKSKRTPALTLIFLLFIYTYVSC